MSASGPPAIFFHSDAVETKGKDLVGRRSAGQSFLRAFLRYVPGDEVRVVTQGPGDARTFKELAAALGETRPLVIKTLRGGDDFAAFGTVFFPSPGFLGASWRRQRLGPSRCSLVGVTHTVSTRRVIESLHTQMLEPVEPWDAIICTSRAVHSVVARQFELEADYIRQRFQAGRVPMPQLPIIPLGIDTESFRPDPDQRVTLRTRFSVPETGVVIMTMGRLTSVEKANPAPLLLVLEELARDSAIPIHLWMVGWSSRDDEKALHERAARTLAPSVRTEFIDGRDPDIRRHIWSGADIFTLPVDNIQETFGLVPVEAMAAGLPVVMPDWNGFRDTVLHGETGFLILTAMPAPGTRSGDQLAGRFADGTDDYLRYLSLIQQQTQIDLAAYRAALSALIADPALRRRMGETGKRHVSSHFDWSAIVPRYLALARALAAQRNAAPSTPPLARGAISPVEIDPFDLYRTYPSHHVTPETMAHHNRPVTEADLDALDEVNNRALYNRRILPNRNTAILARHIAEAGPLSMTDLAALSGERLEATIGAVLFLAKYDFVSLTPQESK